MKHHLFLVACLAAASALTSCTNDDSDLDSLVADYDAALIEGLTPIVWDATPLSESDPVTPGDNDFEENTTWDYHVNIAFSADGATVTGDRSVLRQVTVEGGRVTVRSVAKGVEYTLSGTTDNGCFKVYSDSKFKITLNGVSIHNPAGAAINNQGGKSLYVAIAAGTENRLSDGTEYATPATEDEKGTLFSEGQVIFSGNGTLTVDGSCKNGICSDDYIVFRPGNVINVTTAAGHGIKANDGVTIRGGVLNVMTTADGAKGINSEASVSVSGGRATVITSGNSLVEDTDTTSSAGIKCDSSFVQTAGAVLLKSTGEGGKGINSDRHVAVSGGRLNVMVTGSKLLSSPKGIKAGADITLTGGEISVFSAKSTPIDAAGSLVIGQGYMTYDNGSRRFTLSY